jgi:SOS-response transcriptional repressor LexA
MQMSIVEDLANRPSTKAIYRFEDLIVRVAERQKQVPATVEIPSSVFVKHPRAFALIADGKCMQPTVMHGDIVVIDPDLKPAISKSMIALRVKEKLLLGRMLHVFDQIILLHDNPEYRNLTFAESAVEVVGTVVWLVGNGEFNERSREG